MQGTPVRSPSAPRALRAAACALVLGAATLAAAPAPAPAQSTAFSARFSLTGSSGPSAERMRAAPRRPARAVPASEAGTRAIARAIREDLSRRRLLIPVQGVEPDELRDTYDEARSGGRVHDAIDIHAPLGTPVLAVTDATVLRFHEGDRGGKSIYLLDDDGRTRYYYAHLDSYAEGLERGDRVERGQVIGFVGDTGNAQPGDYHLHFSIALLTDRSRWWQGENLNPYPMLVEGEAVP